MKSSTRWTFVGVSAVALTVLCWGGATPSYATSSTTTEVPAFNRRMKELASALSDLMIDVSSDSRWNNERSFSRINKEAERLAKLAHDLEGKDMKGASANAKNDSMQILSKLFATETAQAARLLAQGHRKYARDRLRAVMGYCMACHTSLPGAGWSADSESSELSSLNSLEKSHYLASTRQFDRALDSYEEVIGGAQGKTNAFDRERALRAALAIAVRVKQDPARAARLIQGFLATQDMPEYMRDVVKKWGATVEEWKKETPRRKTSEEGLFAEAVRLVAKARALQKYPTDRTAEVLYLRASATLHELLALAPAGKRAAEALLMAGMSYDVLDGLHLWDLHEPYYLTCIQKAPHTDIAQQCYRRFEESTLLSFTGSAGTDVPEEIRSRLDALKIQAWPLQAPGKPN